MTILFVADNIGCGGKERRMIELIKSLCFDPSYKIILIYLTHMEVVYKYIYNYPVTIIEADRKNKYTIAPFFMLRNAIKKYKPDIVHSWSSMGSLYLLPLLVFRKFNFINGIISDAPDNIHWYQKQYIRGRVTYPFSDVVLSNSLAGIRSYHAPAKKTLCIYNGIDMNRFSNLPDINQLKRNIGIDHFRFVVGMVGVFHERKDFNTFIEAAQIITRDHKDICFLLIGEGENRASLENLLSKEDRKNIFFLGVRVDVEALVQLFDVGVLCTNRTVHGEGISNSIIEYMSLQKPVIATEGGGTNEVIIHDENGYLIADKDVNALVKNILYLYDHPETAKRMGEAGRKTINSKFLLKRMTDEFVEVYHRK